MANRLPLIALFVIAFVAITVFTASTRFPRTRLAQADEKHRAAFAAAEAAIAKLPQVNKASVGPASRTDDDGGRAIVVTLELGCSLIATRPYLQEISKILLEKFTLELRVDFSRIITDFKDNGGWAEDEGSSWAWPDLEEYSNERSGEIEGCKAA